MQTTPLCLLQRYRLLPCLFLLLISLIAAGRLAAAPLAVYDDKLENGFSDWSWAVVNFSQTAVVHTGTAAISFEPDSWQGLFFHRDAGIDTAVYDAVELYVKGGGGGGQNVTVALTIGGNRVGSAASFATFVPGGAISSTQWLKVRVPFASLGVTSGTFDGFWLQDATGGNQAPIYVDDVQLTLNTTPPPPPPVITVAVDPTADRHAISPLIFGVNFGDDAQANRLHWPVRRWGGNATTRYSWQDDIANRASDYLFYNIENDNAHPELLPAGSASDVFIDGVRASGGQPLITIPLIGWTPIDRTRRWGFSVAKYGAQQQTECTLTGNASWCNGDAGNGLHPNGTPITGNDPHDTSREIDPSFVTGWMAHIASRVGTAAAGGVKFFALDNEPALWNSTHRDVHPSPTTYDELWQRTSDYASAMKARDPAVQILGPSDWGWCAYLYSAADGCSPGPDMAAHGNLELNDWYLKQVADYQTAHGVRLVDYLDVHFYPQAANVSLSDDESAATSAVRLRSLKSLYDPTYTDESWIGQKIDLVPRMKAWIAGRLPATKIAISEYNWGGDNGISSALAQAEALAIFGREGVDLAARWVAPAANTAVEDAFLLYMSYDGLGSNVAGDSVRAVSSNVDAVGAYAVRGAGTRLFVLLFNKDTVDRTAQVQVPGLSATATLFRFDGTHRLGAAGSASPSGGVLTLTLPARSATLAVTDIPVASAALGFYTLPPCRVVDTRNATGAYGGPALSAGVERTFALAGQCGIPAGARAVSMNLTVITPTQTGVLHGYAAGTSTPVASSISFKAGLNRSNNAVLPVAADGTAALALRPEMTSGTVHLVLDVNGYFAAASAVAADGEEASRR